MEITIPLRLTLSPAPEKWNIGSPVVLIIGQDGQQIDLVGTVDGLSIRHSDGREATLTVPITVAYAS
jgi:hypothetical protein